MPPEILLRFFRWFCNPAYAEDIEGDLNELFYKDAASKGERKARWLFIFHVLKLFRPAIIRRSSRLRLYSNNYSMFKNYLLTAFRNMKREKLFAIMNIAGLAIGIGCGLVIYKIITHELSYDKHQTNYKNLYRLVIEFNHPQYGVGISEGQVHPIGEALRNDFPGVNAMMTYYATEAQVTVIDKNGNPDRFQEYKGVGYAEPNFFQLFDYDFIAGDPDKALMNKGSVVITSSLAQKYFKVPANDVASVIGKNITINNSAVLQITAVVADPPATTDIPFTLIGNYKDQPASNPYFRDGTDWHEYNSNTNCYILLSGTLDAATLQSQLLPGFLLKYSGADMASFAKYALQPLADLHYDTRVANYNKRVVSYTTLSVLGVIGLFLVISACINFINMSTAQAIKRAKEIGVRKSLGVKKVQLVRQFLGETIFIAIISSFVGLVIAQLLFISLQGILGYQLQVEVFHNLNELLFLVLMVIAVGLLSGFYPALVMAGMNPIKALKNNMNKGASGLLSLRRSLVVVQFVISQVLIIGTIIAGKQMDFFMGNEVGFEREAILIMKIPGSPLEKMESTKRVIQSLPGVEKVSLSVASPMARFRVSNEIEHPSLGKENRIDGNLKTADEDYIDLFHLKLIAGRNLSEKKNATEAVVTRKLTKSLGYDTPEAALGDKFKYSGDMEFTIVGVIEDFHSTSFHNPLENVILANLPWNIFQISVKIKTASGNFSEVQSIVNNIKSEWEKLYPENIFDYSFLDDQVATMYENERKTSQLFQIFSAIAIFIGCLGLYGLVSYMANQKTKEIGIRKVMGASTASIFGIFSKEMVMLVSAAFVVAAPLAWYVMKGWLEEFQFKVPISPMFFAAALVASLLIALITIGYKAIAASRANPVDSLRSE